MPNFVIHLKYIIDTSNPRGTCGAVCFRSQLQFLRPSESVCVQLLMVLWSLWSTCWCVFVQTRGVHFERIQLFSCYRSHLEAWRYILLQGAHFSEFAPHDSDVRVITCVCIFAMILKKSVQTRCALFDKILVGLSMLSADDEWCSTTHVKSAVLRFALLSNSHSGIIRFSSDNFLITNSILLPSLPCIISSCLSRSISVVK